MRARWIAALFTAMLTNLMGSQPSAAPSQPLRVLMMVGGGYHDFVGNPKLLVEGLSSRISLQVTTLSLADKPAAKEPAAASLLNAKMREQFDVVLAYHQGELLELSRTELDHLLHFVRSGGAWVGLHSAADSFKWCRDYVTMVGGKFASHPPIGPLKSHVLAAAHPVLHELSDFEHPDEFYYLDDCDLGDKHVLIVGHGPTDGRVRPLAWVKEYGQGRVFYTALGHGPQAFKNPALLSLIANALRWTTAHPHWHPGADGWRELWDGKSLQGWTHSGPGSFKLVDGTLQTNGGMGLLWFDRLQFVDFELEVEFRLTTPTSNAGVFLRFPPPNSPWDAVNQGYEAQICDTGGDKTNTGSIYSFASATELASKQIGEWNQMNITARGQEYRVLVNGKLVCQFAGDRGTRGHIGLQNHGAEDVVQFRRVRARDLPR